MADFDSSLPVRTETNGDVAVKVVDGTIVSQALLVNPDGSINVNASPTSPNVNIHDAAGNPFDENWGVVGANTLRTAAEIGNATGAADFNAGATGAQTLRTSANQGAPNTIGNAWPVEITDGTNTLLLTGTGQLTVDITSPLPTGSNVIGAVTQSGGPWSVTLPYDENWGVVGANTLRTAAEIGNATGAASFNYGAVSAQTLRTAAQIGNATGAADFGAGATTAQTLRVSSNLLDATGTAFSLTNPLPVTVDTVPGTAVDDYKDAAAIAANASDTHFYTVTAGKTLYFDQVIAAASGKAKMLVAVETGVATGIFTTKFVQFNSTAETNMDVTLASPIAVAAGVRVEVIMTNLDKAAQDLYSTICGNEI